MNLSVQASQMVIGACVLPTCLSEVLLRLSEPKALHPVAGVDYPGMYQQLKAWFADNASCVASWPSCAGGRGSPVRSAASTSPGKPARSCGCVGPVAARRRDRGHDLPPQPY